MEKSYSIVHGLVFSSSRRIEWYTFWPWGDVKVTWPELRWFKIIGKKLPCPQVPLFWLFYPCDVIFERGPKMTAVKIVDLVRPYPMPCIVCVYSLLCIRDLRGAIIRPPPVRRWPKPPTVCELKGGHGQGLNLSELEHVKRFVGPELLYPA